VTAPYCTRCGGPTIAGRRHEPRVAVDGGHTLILLPAVVYGGTSILSLLIGDPGYAQNELCQDLWRAGYAHTGVLLVLSLVTLRYVDEANLPGWLKSFARHSIPAAAILLPAAFFLAVLSPDATEPNAMIYLAFVGAVSMASGVLVLGIGLIRRPRNQTEEVR
jgi:hypothetical protein